ncbi:Rox3-domain-containing protein, partial [Morchella conica CCBAS932]
PNSTLLTPTSSAAGTVPPTTSHEDTDGDTNMEEDDEKSHKRRRTSSSPYDRNAPTTAPALRYRNSMSQGYMPDASPPIPSEHEVLSQPDVSTYYLVCPKPHEPSYPDLTDNLLALYGLRPIADSVARFNPATGVKNKLRKSYKGFINDLPGKNIVVTKASQTDPNSAGDAAGDANKMDLLGTLLMWPEEEWYNQNVHGKELSKGLDMNKLRKGLNMTKGDIPGFDASILGLEDELRRKAPHATAATTPAVAVGTPHVNGSTPGGLSSVSAGGDDARPKRSKKRRRYDDNSYEGYGDDDEDGPPVNNGSGGGGGDRGGGLGGGLGGNGPGSGGRDLGGAGREGWNEEKKKKKRKKVMSSLGL